jgi:hypothetical protein
VCVCDRVCVRDKVSVGQVESFQKFRDKLSALSRAKSRK